VDACAFLGLHPTHNPTRWVLPISAGITGGRGQLFGGCALGAAALALEALTERPLAWATCQYLANAFPPDIVDIDLRVAVVGHQVTQARAIGHVADREVFSVQAALGHRTYPGRGRWVEAPDVPGPDRCPPLARGDRDPGGLSSRMEQRVAHGQAREDGEFEQADDGRIALWMRLPGELAGTAMGQCVVGDMLPSAVRAALGERIWGSSLDNTVRLFGAEPTEWVLVDFRVDVVANGFSTGTGYVWSEDRQLLGLASQTTTVSADRPAGQPERPS
jgi:acyl-CoA thioesterase II